MRVYRFLPLLALTGVLLVLCQVPLRAHEDPNPQRAPLLVTVRTDKTLYAPGEPVILRMTVRNPLTTSVTVHFHTFQLHDFFIHDAFGGELWRWSADKFFAQALTTWVLAAGETWVIEATWNQTTSSGQPVGSGFYTVRGRVTGHPSHDSNGALFRIRG